MGYSKILLFWKYTMVYPVLKQTQSFCRSLLNSLLNALKVVIENGVLEGSTHFNSPASLSQVSAIIWPSFESIHKCCYSLSGPEKPFDWFILCNVNPDWSSWLTQRHPGRLRLWLLSSKWTTSSGIDGPFIDELPIKKWWFSTSILVCPITLW